MLHVENTARAESVSPVGIKNDAGEWVAYVRSIEEAFDLTRARNVLPVLVAITQNAVEIIGKIGSITDDPSIDQAWLKTTREFLAMLNQPTANRLDENNFKA